MKILTDKRYKQLLDKIEQQEVAIENKRIEYDALDSLCKQEIEIVNRQTKDLEDAKIYNQRLQERLNDSQKQIRELSQEIRHLEAEIERKKNRF